MSNLEQSFYSVTTSTGATRRLSANQKPILKQRNERVDLKGNYHIFLIGLTFDPKIWPSLKALRVFCTAEMQTLLILLLQREIILELDLNSSVARQKRKKSPFIGNACVLEKIILVIKRVGCYNVSKTSI